MSSNPKIKKIKFPKSSCVDFYPEVKRRVDEFFKSNHLSSHADTSLYLKSFLLLLIYLALYCGMISNHFHLLGLVVLYGLLGITKGVIGFNLIHDALHQAFSKHKWVNAAIGYWFDLNGTSSFIWKISHNQHHHVYTNIPGHDDDIDKAILLRLSPADKIYPFHRFQHMYALILYSLIGFNWVFYSDYAWFWRENKNSRISKRDLLLFLGFKFVNLFLFLGLPLAMLTVPWWVIILGYISMHICAGIVISIVFQLAHIVEDVFYFESDMEGNMQYSWVIHELMTTSNFATHNKFLTQLIGGLNFQIEHHLFPQISHVHYFEISKIVKATAEEYGLPYIAQPTLGSAISSHFRALKKLATMELTKEGFAKV